MIELVLSALGTVWAFIVSVVITAGLNQTCSAFAEAFKDNNADKFPYAIKLITIDCKVNILQVLLLLCWNFRK